MTRLAIGPSWATLSPAQQQQLTEAFRHYIAATYADRFDSYSGEQLQVTGERPTTRMSLSKQGSSNRTARRPPSTI